MHRRKAKTKENKHSMRWNILTEESVEQRSWPAINWGKEKEQWGERIKERRVHGFAGEGRREQWKERRMSGFASVFWTRGVASVARMVAVGR